MDALQESGWEELRKEARKIEGDLDVKLSSYAKLGARFNQGGMDFLRAHRKSAGNLLLFSC
ncbi:UNVERIFIED_CONTAM: Golgi SNAP receptor complex member 1-2 [Sesamum radiatum]|uniref:Golgi SNAP receptor complex member 1-2 n=1 Tax=Sesamum radiatum TaxID=300843 RepID=A0AAW2KR22_SESRA